MKNDFLKYGNLVAFLAVVVFNILATAGLIGGVTTRDVSYMYKSLLTPADYAFSIWALIYVLLAILVFRQMRNEYTRDSLGYWFMISCVLNVAWIIAWQLRSIGLSFVIILALLIDLIMLMKTMKGSDLLSSMAIGLYTGWINVAMLANLGALFTKNNWFLFGMNSSAAAVLGLAFGLMWITFFLFSYSNAYYGIAACWGYLAIAIASNSIGIKIISIFSMIVFSACTIYIMTKKTVDATIKY